MGERNITDNMIRDLMCWNIKFEILSMLKKSNGGNEERNEFRSRVESFSNLVNF